MGTCANAIIARGKRIAAQMLATEPDKVEFKDGRFRSDNAQRSFDVFEVARAAQTLNDLDDDLRGPLAAESDQTFTDGGYPYGAAVCEVEIEPDTGAIEIVRYAAVDDVGRAVNPMILHGQTHGGIAQGVGQAMWEHCIVDPDSGQVMTGSFMDYAMPRADVTAVVQDRADGGAIADQSARRARRRRGRHHARARRGGERGGRRAARLRRRPHGHADNAGKNLARDHRRQTS